MQIQHGMYHQKRNGQRLEANQELRQAIMETKGFPIGVGRRRRALLATRGSLTSTTAT